MSRTRMEWGWVGEYPIFVYMNFLDHGKWNVWVVKGMKGNQNAGDTGPTAKPWFKYIVEGRTSRRDVLIDALGRTKQRLGKEQNEKIS